MSLTGWVSEKKAYYVTKHRCCVPRSCLLPGSNPGRTEPDFAGECWHETMPTVSAGGVKERSPPGGGVRVDGVGDGAGHCPSPPARGVESVLACLAKRGSVFIPPVFVKVIWGGGSEVGG